MRAIVTLFILSVLVLPAAVHACGMSYRDSSSGNLPGILRMDQVFVGRVVSVQRLKECCGGSKFPFWDFVLEVDEVMNGGGIRPTENVRTIGSVGEPLVPGDRVIASSWRAKNDEGRLWGGVRKIGATEMVLARDNDHETYTLNELREAALRARDELSMAPFDTVDAFDLIVLDSFTQDSLRVKTWRCTPLRRVAGRSSTPPTRIRFERFDPEPGPFLDPGDTLLVPSRAGEGSNRIYATTSNGFRVRDGWLPGFGLPLAQVLEAFERNGDRYVLRPLMPQEP